MADLTEIDHGHRDPRPDMSSREVEPTRFDALCLVDRDGRIVHAATALVGRVGIDPNTVHGTRLASWLDPTHQTRFGEALAASRTGPVVCEVAVRTTSGQLRPCAVLLERIADDQAGLISVVVRDLGADDDRARREQREHDLLRRITEAANSTSETSTLFARAVADLEETMGWRSGRVLPATPSPDPGSEPASIRRARRTAQPQWSRDADTAPDRTGPPAATVALPVIADGAVTEVLLFESDQDLPFTADDRPALGEVGHQLGSVLERELLAAQLAEQTAEFERSNAELERFAYVASHDLQEPLRKIVGFSELLHREYEDRLDEVGREYLGYVVDATQRMQQLIRDLLAYSRAGQAAPAVVEVDLDALAASVLDTMQWTIEEAGAHVTVSPLPTVRGDPHQLDQILTNLLSNAVKYADDDGATIAIAAERLPEGGRWEITVADDGIGIEPRFAEQVFDVFRRLHAADEYPGTGIGLAITRRLIEANGGRVWVTPNEPRGSVFHLTLDAAPENA